MEIITKAHVCVDKSLVGSELNRNVLSRLERDYSVYKNYVR